MRRVAPRPRTIAWLGAEPALALRVVRRLPRPDGGGGLFLVDRPNAGLRDAAGAFAAAGWTLRGLGLDSADWLADPAGRRVDALVAYRLLGRMEEAAARALLDGVPRRAGGFVALEAHGTFADGALTALWPAWHSCVIREGRGWRVDLFEAVSL